MTEPQFGGLPDRPARKFDSLAWPSPLIDETIRVDPFAGAEVVDGSLIAQLASGDRVPVRVTTPGEGVLRFRIGQEITPRPPRRPSAMLVEHAEQPATLMRTDEVVDIRGAGITATWSIDDGALEFGEYRRAPAGVARAGRIESHGWLETIALDPDGAVYGGGEGYQGSNLRGRVRRLVNSETHLATGYDLAYINVPFFWSDSGWGAFFHTGGVMRADLGAVHSEVAAFAVEDPVLDLFLINGDSPTILKRYLALTGKPGSFPEWALGVWMSRCSYLSAAEIEGVLDELEAAECPVDVVHVDAWLEGNVIEDFACNWTIDRERFPAGWTKRLRDRGVRTSLWHNPYVIKGTSLGEKLAADHLVVRRPDGTPATTPDKDDRYLVDFTNPEAVDWWQKRVTEVASTENPSAFKGDFGEEVPEEGRFFDGKTGRAIRNEYALLYQKATHEALERLWETNEIAMFNRSGTAGAQRYPCHWVGDSASTWTGLVSALRACLSLSLSGFGFVGHDVGGFWTPESFEPLKEAFERMDGSGLRADVDPELYARWSQWGALSPVMRFHGSAPREPTAYPEPARSVAIRACRLREELRPYLAAAANVATRQGVPMMRPMPLAFPGDRAARDADLQYMLGDDILVAPILEPGGSRRFWIPPGRWEPLWGLQAIDGPGWIEVRCELDQFPAFTRTRT